MRPCAIALAAVEILDQSRESVELGAGGIPPEENFFGVGFEMQREHLLLVVHIDFDLLHRFGVADGEAIADFDLGAIFAAGAEEGADDAFLVGVAAKGVVED